MIIGITGTIGAGKGTVVEYLVSKKGFKHFSARAFITEEIVRRGMEVNRDAMVSVANDLRAKHDPAFVISSLYEQAVQVSGDSVIESIRTPGEVAAMRGKPNFHLLAVDAEKVKRYERIKARSSETDHITFEEFVAQEKREMHSDDPNKQNLAECIKQADVIIRNDGTFDQLYQEVEQFLGSVEM